MNIILHHKRHPELVNDVHLWSGTIELQGEDAKRLKAESFVGLQYRKVLAKVSNWLREAPDAGVVFRRTDRPGLQPILLGEDIRTLLRDDPVRAMRCMDMQAGDVVRGDEAPVVPHPEPALRAGFDTMADAFSERVFMRMRNGMIEDPLTGRWLQLAFGPKIGWRIRAENNNSASWLPIRLEDVRLPEVSEDVKEEDLQKLMPQVSGALAACRWASLEVEDLLAKDVERFFLPRRWNAGQKWIGRGALRARLEKYKKEKVES
jgi:hypothetical protein